MQSFYSKQLKGFSLLEIVVSVAVISVLAALLFQGIQGARNRSLAVGCIANLHEVSKAMLLYASDHNNRINIYSSMGGTGASVQWLRFLVGTGSGITHKRITGGPVYLERKDASICPAENPYHWNSNNNHGYTYGAMFYNSDDPYNTQPAGAVSGSREIILNRLESPSTYWLLSDSFGSPSVDRQFYFISQTATPGGQNGKVHFRHEGRANVLFADGHVRSLTPEEFKKLNINPISNGFDQHQNYISF